MRLYVQLTFYLTCAGDTVNSGSEVLNDGHGAALDSQDAGQLEDHVLGAGPAAELPGQLDTNHLGALDLPGDVRHHVHGVSAAHTATETAETSAIRAVKVNADHQESWKERASEPKFQSLFIVIML